MVRRDDEERVDPVLHPVPAESWAALLTCQTLLIEYALICFMRVSSCQGSPSFEDSLR